LVASTQSLALRGDGTHDHPLEAADRDDAADRGDEIDHEHYKETSLGGLAVNVPNC